jgi:thiamine biosynthesis lipoprotein
VWSKSPNRAALSLLAACAAFADSPNRHEAVEPHMGTLVRIVFYADDASPVRAAFARIAEIDRALSDYKADSDLNRLCAAQSGELTGDLAALIPTALAIARETNGAFDPTLASLTRHMSSSPGQYGWQRVTLDANRIALNGVCFDLGGIAKGYAAQEALRALAAQGVTRAMVAVSGDICASGGEWKVGAQARTVVLTNACISTSGNESQPGHIFDPRTGQRSLRSGQVTVLSPSGPRADALATAHHVISPPGTWIDERK